jgi:hypothetical protein
LYPHTFAFVSPDQIVPAKFFIPPILFLTVSRNRKILLAANSTNQNHGKKRRRIGSPPDSQLRPRTRRVRSSGFDIRSLSAAQLVTLSEAASILQVPPSALLDLAPKAQHKIKRPSKRPRRVSSEMAGNRSHSGDSPPTADCQSSLSIHNNSSNTYPTDSTHESCNVSSFGIGLMPKQIAECFANFIPPSSEQVLETEYTGSSLTKLEKFTYLLS